MDRDDRARDAHLDARANDAVHLVLHLRVATLHRVEIRRRRARPLAARLVGRGAAAEAHEKDAKQGLLVQPKPPAAPAPMKVTFAAALPPFYRDTVAAWLRDDCPSLDVGGLVVGDAETTATLWCKSSGVLAGRPLSLIHI